MRNSYSSALPLLVAVLLLPATSLAAEPKESEDASSDTETEKVDAPKFADAAGLLKFGITLGIAAAVHVPHSEQDDGPQQKSLALSAMPYVVITPAAVMRLGGITREYCTSSGLTLDRRAAQKYANQRAEALARDMDPIRMAKTYDPKRPTDTKTTTTETVAKVTKKTATGTTETTETVSRVTTKQTQTPAETRIQTTTVIETKTTKAPGGPVEEQAESKTETRTEPTLRSEPRPAAIKDLTGWDVEKPGSCWPFKFGVYAGFPFKYDADYSAVGEYSEVQAKLTTRPFISAGFAIVPFPYLAALIGATWASTDIPEIAATDSSPVVRANTRSTWSWTIGLGGNLDVFKPLLGL